MLTRVCKLVNQANIFVSVSLEPVFTYRSWFSSLTPSINVHWAPWWELLVEPPNLFPFSIQLEPNLSSPFIGRYGDLSLHSQKVNGRDGATSPSLDLKKNFDHDFYFACWLKMAKSSLTCLPWTATWEGNKHLYIGVSLLHQLTLHLYKCKCFLGTKSCATCWGFSLAKYTWHMSPWNVQFNIYPSLLSPLPGN